MKAISQSLLCQLQLELLTYYSIRWKTTLAQYWSLLLSIGQYWSILVSIGGGGSVKTGKTQLASTSC